LPRIGFLFPGQGSPSHLSGGALRHRFASVQDIYALAELNETADEIATAIAQPAIVTASLGALRILNSLEISAQIAVGHSLGELTAVHWSGAIDETGLLRIARARGRVMTESSNFKGAMASIGAEGQKVLSLLNGECISIACLNSPTQTVISGEASAVEQVMARARANNLTAIKLPVSHAFHSSLVAPAAPVLTKHLSSEKFNPLRRSIVSTVTGKHLEATTDLPDLLVRQITSPVVFLKAVTEAETEPVDLWLEVGPGQVLCGIMSEVTETPVISIDAGSESLRGLLCSAGAIFVLGQPMNYRALFTGRFTRPFDLDWHPEFFVNPCELAPVSEMRAPAEVRERVKQSTDQATDPENDKREISALPDSSILELVRQRVAERAELPASAIEPESRLLSDLHLNSITVSQLVAETARHLLLPPPISPTDFADAKVSELVLALEEQQALGGVSPAGETDPLPSGINSWIRPFRVELVERALPHRQSTENGHWQVLAALDDQFAESLHQKFRDCEVGNGVVVCLPPEANETIVDQLLAAARFVLEEKENTRFVIVQRGVSAASFARTLHLEEPHVTTCVVSVPQFHNQAADWVLAEALAAEGHAEAHYDISGKRYESLLRPLPFCEGSGQLHLSGDDVLVVTGGGKGITAECVLALAKGSNARLVLVGRALPDADAELSSNLSRMRAAGIDFTYMAVDVTDVVQVRQMVETVETDIGPITGIIHGAAINEPQPIRSLGEEAFRRTLAVKVDGARNLLAAVNPKTLKLLITFGSVVARTGLPGEADYGLANEWLTSLTEDWKRAHPSCRCLAVEWSIWFGKGMGERLGRVERLMRQGITPIPPDEGVTMLRQLLGRKLPSASIIVMSRFRDLPTFTVERVDLPFLRFLEETRVYYPQIELVVDSELSTSTDPYLDDHVFQRERLLPAVIGLEAMAQAAIALIGAQHAPIFENVRFTRAVAVPAAKPLKIRLAALRVGPNVVDVVLRSAETDFKVDHFQTRCRFEGAASVEESNTTIPSHQISLDPKTALYGKILFQNGRFQRLRNYRLLRATECIVEITANKNGDWFNRYLPQELLLGDPGARDACLHAIQACIPHATILPVGVGRVVIKHAAPAGSLFMHAIELSREGNTFTYNLTVSNADGHVYERWERLQLVAIPTRSMQSCWDESLVGPYLERQIQELIPGASISAALVRSTETDRHARSDCAIRLALNEDAQILRRADGRPEVDGRFVSTSHSDQLTLAAAGEEAVACDIEAVIERQTSTWLDLLGSDSYGLAKLISRTVHEDVMISATRVWTAKECLKKVGVASDAGLCWLPSHRKQWVLLSAGTYVVATYETQIHDHVKRRVLSILVRGSSSFESTLK